MHHPSSPNLRREFSSAEFYQTSTVRVSPRRESRYISHAALTAADAASLLRLTGDAEPRFPLEAISSPYRRIKC